MQPQRKVRTMPEPKRRSEESFSEYESSSDQSESLMHLEMRYQDDKAQFQQKKFDFESRMKKLKQWKTRLHTGYFDTSTMDSQSNSLLSKQVSKDSTGQVDDSEFAFSKETNARFANEDVEARQEKKGRKKKSTKTPQRIMGDRVTDSNHSVSASEHSSLRQKQVKTKEPYFSPEEEQVKEPFGLDGSQRSMGRSSSSSSSSSSHATKRKSSKNSSREGSAWASKSDMSEKPRNLVDRFKEQEKPRSDRGSKSPLAVEQNPPGESSSFDSLTWGYLDALDNVIQKESSPNAGDQRRDSLDRMVETVERTSSRKLSSGSNMDLGIKRSSSYREIPLDDSLDRKQSRVSDKRAPTISTIHEEDDDDGAFESNMEARDSSDQDKSEDEFGEFNPPQVSSMRRFSQQRQLAANETEIGTTTSEDDESPQGARAERNGGEQMRSYESMKRESVGFDLAQEYNSKEMVEKSSTFRSRSKEDSEGKRPSQRASKENENVNASSSRRFSSPDVTPISDQGTTSSATSIATKEVRSKGRFQPPALPKDSRLTQRSKSREDQVCVNAVLMLHNCNVARVTAILHELVVASELTRKNKSRFCNNSEIDTLISKAIICRKQSETFSTNKGRFCNYISWQKRTPTFLSLSSQFSTCEEHPDFTSRIVFISLL